MNCVSMHSIDISFTHPHYHCTAAVDVHLLRRAVRWDAFAGAAQRWGVGPFSRGLERRQDWWEGEHDTIYANGVVAGGDAEVDAAF